MSEMKLCSDSLYDEYPKLKTFRANFMRNHPGINIDLKNLYLIQSINQDGEVTEENYGLNLITDAGVDLTIADYNNPSTKLALLEGVPQAEASSVLDYAFPTYDRMINNTSSDTNNGAIYPMTYDSVSGVVSQRRKATTWIYDYNIDGITSDMTVNCLIYYGSASNSNYNKTPSLKVTTYDINGLAAPIIKHINEKLSITLFTVASFSETLIDDAYDRGIYLSMNPARLNHYIWGGLSWGKQIQLRGPVYTGYSTSASNIGNNTYTNCGSQGYGSLRYMMNSGEFSDYTKATMNTIILDPRTSYTKSTLRFGNYWSSGYSDGNACHITTEVHLTSPEEITCETVFTDSNESCSLANTFGLKVFDVTKCTGLIPVADFSISSVKGYNFTTHAWDIDLAYVNAPNAYYDNPFNQFRLEIGVSGAAPQWSNFLYTNPRAKNITGRPPAVPVTGFTSSASTVRTMYATDKWWDFSSWSLIQNIANIPSALQNKKYYISSGGDNETLYPTYDQQVHELNVGTAHTVLNAPAPDIWSYGFKPIINKTSGWILVQQHILFMSGNDVTASFKLTGPEYTQWGYTSAEWSRSYQNLYVYSSDEYVPNTSSSYNSRTTYYTNAIDEYTIRYNVGDKLLVGSHVGDCSACYPTAVRLYTIIDSSTAPTYIDIQIDTNATTTRDKAMYSGSQSGYYVIQNHTSHCANIISMTDGTVVKLENVDYCYAVEFSNYCVYMETGSSPITFKIYDMTTNTIKDSFELPSEYSDITFICGWGDYMYIKSHVGTSDYVHIVNVEAGSISLDPTMAIPNTFVTDGSSSSGGRTNAWRINMLATQLYTEELMVLINPGIKNLPGETVPVAVKYDQPNVVFDLFKNGSLSERPIDTGYEVNTYSGKTGSLTASLVHDIQSVSQSKLLLVDICGVSATSGNGNMYQLNALSAYYPVALDIGPAVDSSSQIVLPKSRYLNYADSTYCHGTLAYWNNGFIQFDKEGAGVWRPMHWFIQCQVTGTTTTIQAYNNPKKIGHHSYELLRTNRGIIQHSEPVRSTGDINMVFKHDNVVYPNSDNNGYTYMRTIKGEVLGPYQQQVSVPSGTTIRIEVVPKSEFSFLVGTFKWYIQDMAINYNANGDYSSSGIDWTSSVANADDSGQQNGTAITLDRNIDIIGINIATSYSTMKTLEPAMIESIKITCDPHLST